MSSIHQGAASTKREDPQILSPPPPPTANPSSPSSSISKRPPTKLKRVSHQRKQSRSARQQSVTPTPSIASTTSSLSDIKNVFSSWFGNIRAGVSEAWNKAKGEYDTYLATREGESRVQRRRKEITNLTESTIKSGPPTKKSAPSSDMQDNAELAALGGKRPATNDAATTLPALKKRSTVDNTKKIKKQKSLGKLGFRKSSISNPVPISNELGPPPAPLRPPPAPVYRGTASFAEEDDGLRTRVQSLETEINSLRAKVRWFEQSYGEIPTESLVGIQKSLTESTMQPKAQRKSAFKEELETITSENMGESWIGDESILPKDVKALKGFNEKDNIDIIAEVEEVTERDDRNDVTTAEEAEVMERIIPPESTIKLIQPSPSTKSIPSPSRLSVSPSKIHESPPPSPTEDRGKSINLLETLSPIHPNIIPALVPHPSRPDLAQQSIRRKLEEFAE
jgi:hypothetical protein